MQVHGGPPTPPPPRIGKHGAAQVEPQPEAHRDSNRLVIEGKAARCNWHCYQPVRRVKAGCRIQPGPADQIISSEAYLGLIPFDHRPVPCALPRRVWNGGFWHGSPVELDELLPVLTHQGQTQPSRGARTGGRGSPRLKPNSQVKPAVRPFGHPVPRLSPATMPGATGSRPENS